MQHVQFQIMRPWVDSSISHVFVHKLGRLSYLRSFLLTLTYPSMLRNSLPLIWFHMSQFWAIIFHIKPTCLRRSSCHLICCLALYLLPVYGRHLPIWVFHLWYCIRRLACLLPLSSRSLFNHVSTLVLFRIHSFIFFSLRGSLGLLHLIDVYLCEDTVSKYW